jgi:hypothetical protein
MSGDELKAIAAHMDLAPSSIYDLIRNLFVEGLFDAPIPSERIVDRIRERFGKRMRTAYVQTYMRKFMSAGIARAVKPKAARGNYYVIASVTREDALRDIGKERRVVEMEAQLFSDTLMKALTRDFSTELAELQTNFGRHGNATAFLLRKVLEKLLIIVFGKLGRTSAIEDKSRPGGWRGLQEIVDIASREKVNGLPILTGRTATELRGIKFLGDTAAHNPLVNVEMPTILPQMPFLITAFGELSRFL